MKLYPLSFLPSKDLLEKRLARLLLAACMTSALASCQALSFYTQAIRGQAEITFTKVPVSKVLQSPATTPELAAKLQLAQELVDFAESELALDASGSYRHYADLQRDHVTYIVYAAPEFSLEPKTWWYPIVGEQDYRGYFQKEDAKDLVAQLEEEGFDTYLGGVSAYSTLGFFNDPLLNTFIEYPEVDLAELIFHELTHQRYFEKKETSFNEALAEVVAREGTRRWLRKKGDRQALATYELRLKRRSAIRSEIESSIARLKKLYATPLPAEEMRRRKTAELQSLHDEVKKLYAGWQQKPSHFLSTPLNNARLVSFTTYEALVPELQKRLESHGRGLEAFFQDIEKNGRLLPPSP
ncbi:aminopeptidase [Roseibacillus persicicus]|uniref:aminopeptidase n=1 Tax=Roseibacillus persicicus TaxID=454148 RepID=UPI00398B786C